GKNWMEIGFVQSKAPEGTSTEKLNYSLYDNAPAKGINYYRLVQIDFDNNEKVTEVKTVSFGKYDTNSIKLFPNPVAGDLHVEGLSSGMQIKLVDARGAVISQFSAETSTAKVISTDKLSKGVYFLQVGTDNSNMMVVRFIKM
ncbi:MAG TPA: T9SS type A sorting domain-containing protein, partial [Chitinophagaceae bacterium]|nr:T9SS type A sorting domain-containing protein [Chitinophagaceae bacterium]